jgi:hypothetical protein
MRASLARMRRHVSTLILAGFAGACGSSGDDTGASTTDASTGPTPTSAPTTGDPPPTTGPTPTTGDTSDTGGEGTAGASTGTGTSTGDDTTGGTAETGEPGCESGPFEPRDESLTKVNQHLSTLDPETLPFARYVSLADLNNAGLCGEDLARVQLGFTKLVNALSNQPKIAVPEVIDNDGLILHIDLRAYGWDAPVVAADQMMFPDVWELIARTNPYAIQHTGEIAANIAAQTGSELALLPAHAVIGFAARPPLYYDALRAPTSLDALGQALGVDLEAQVAEEMLSDPDEVARATLHVSDVVDFSRVIDRHQLPDASTAAIWRTHDFSGGAGTRNPFVHPFDFEADGGQVIFSLPNGLHGYMTVDASGKRIDDTPIAIQQAPLFPDTVVRAGVSCMQCHTQGLIKANDDLRFELDNNMSEEVFDQTEKNQIRNLNPQREDMDALFVEDIARYVAALADAGVSVETDEEPVSAAFVAFEAPVDLTRAAAEFWLPVDELQTKLGLLPNELAPLADGSVSREVFSANFAEAVCQLALGKTPACP